jgi:hypothetical protein
VDWLTLSIHDHFVDDDEVRHPWLGGAWSPVVVGCRRHPLQLRCRRPPASITPCYILSSSDSSGPTVGINPNNDAPSLCLPDWKYLSHDVVFVAIGDLVAYVSIMVYHAFGVNDEASPPSRRLGTLSYVVTRRTLELSARIELSSIGVVVHAPHQTRERRRATKVHVE